MMQVRFLAGKSGARRCGLAVAGGVSLAVGLARANEVTDWNAKAALLVNEQSPMEQSRSLAIVQLAIHDALNAIEPRYAAYAPPTSANEAVAQGSRAAHVHVAGASAAAAVASAARDTLRVVVPARSADIEAWYAQSLAGIPDGVAEDRGVEVGSQAAARLLRLREDDDVVGALTEPYVAGDQPGDYRATPPFDSVVGAGWGKLATFATPRASAFRPPPPPALDSRRYVRDYEEVKALGVRDGSTRTPEQSEIADFWYESSVTGWLRIANVVVERADLDEWEAARALALVSMALADGFINGFDAKYHFDHWRPITAIRAGDEDGNRRTAGDPSWTPYCDTPPVADYPSTHSVLGAAAAAVLAREFGDQTPFVIDSQSLPGVLRRFTSFSEAARENAASRVYCGIHWRTSTHAGLEQGERIGEHVFEHQLAPACDE
jgi:hypothetical protein